MPFITKLSRNPIGEFTIKFSVKYGKFQISNFPEGVAGKVTFGNSFYSTWEEVNAELDRIRDEYLHEVLFLRKVILIQLRTSESIYETKEVSDWFGKKDEKIVQKDKLSGCEGFELKWYIAEEYQFARDKRYKIIEANKNNHSDFKIGRIDILTQLFYSDNVRLFAYREDLHGFLKNLDLAIAEMLSKLVSYFDPDPEKFIQNFENGKLKLLD